MFTGTQAKVIEDIRAEFNPVQFNLIPAHVTLCREHEIEPIENLVQKLRSIKWRKPLRIEFDQIERFNDGKGVLMPTKNPKPQFDELRELILIGLNNKPEKYFAHITLMHPRNSTCTDEIFDRLLKYRIPGELFFDKISLIEQREGGKWCVVEEF